jgi:hypothetical protein
MLAVLGQREYNRKLDRNQQEVYYLPIKQYVGDFEGKSE